MSTDQLFQSLFAASVLAPFLVSLVAVASARAWAYLTFPDGWGTASYVTEGAHDEAWRLGA